MLVGPGRKKGKMSTHQPKACCGRERIRAAASVRATAAAGGNGLGAKASRREKAGFVRRVGLGKKGKKRSRVGHRPVRGVRAVVD